MQADALNIDAGPASRWRSVAARYRSAAVMATSRLAAVAAQFAVQAAVGALGGASALGILQLFQSWTCIGGEVAARGLPTRAMRDSAVDFARGDIGGIQQRLRQFALAIAKSWIAAAAIIALVLSGLNVFYPDNADSRALAYALCAALVAAPLFALLRLTADTLKAMDAATPAILVESLVIPGVLLGAAAVLWTSGQPMTLAALLLAGIAGYLLAPTAMALLIQRRSAQSARRPLADDAPAPADHGDGNVLWATSLLSVAFLHLPFIVLPFYAATADIGVYAIANKLTGIITMLLLLLAAVFGPAFAREAAGGGRDLDHLLQRSQLYSCVIYLPLAAVLVYASPWLALLFSVPQQELHLMLLILGAGHLVNAATGLSGVLLNMAGASRLELAATAGALAAAVVASPFVGASHGYIGLAVLFSLTLAVKNLASFGFARRYLKQRDTDHAIA
jgi:O-antigen/teichoic acid export membrane protein